ncbi:hypothetical protein FQR65_LT16436 [Abscondita terminalis]|nr:hypothetical protein FQR65_LT16436 [Abscondita terminalis]
MNAPDSNGKKLGFISQEMGREINTLGSKANNAEIQQIVVRMKEELEKIKEQLLNVYSRMKGSSRSASVLSVAIYPGANALTLTPLEAHSLEKAFTREPMAPFEAAYPGTLIPPWNVSREAVNTILPDPLGDHLFPYFAVSKIVHFD